MPALVAFGRRWQVASDDFVFPGFVDILIRVSWLIAGTIIYWKEEEKLGCPGGHFMKIYLTGNYIVLLLILVANIALVQNSMNGFIMDVQARAYVTPSLYFRIILEIPEIGWNVLGTIWVYSHDIICAEAPETLFFIKALVFWSWILVALMIIFVALVFDPLGSKKSYDDLDYDRFHDDLVQGHNKKTKVWEKRCRVLMCSCCGGDEVHRHAFKDVGKIMAFLFDDVDLVPTDIAAGLIVMNLKAQAEANTLRNIGSPGSSREAKIIFEESQILSPHYRSGDWNSPSTIAHFMKFALASYGWPWFLVANPKSGLFKLWENILCCGCCVSHPCSVEGDNCCYCNTSALKQTTSLEDKDILYVSFHNNVFQTPFYIAIDHAQRSIVVAIRGTMSLRDAITDLTAEAKDIEGPGIPYGCKAHYGMMLAARNVLQKINSIKVLDKAVADYPTYTVVLTGHSLGAGAATVLSFLLYQKYPNLRCYAYSPPGGLLSAEAAEFAESFTTSIVVGDDIVGRLSVPAFERFKQKLLISIQDCKLPKYRILVGGCWYFIMGGIPNLENHGRSQNRDNDERHSDTVLLQPDHDAPNYHTYVSLAEVSQKLQRESVTRCPMYLPGKIIHITERPIFQSRPDLVEGSRYEYRWADKSEFADIKVTPKMMVDHYPDNVYLSLQDIASAESEAPTYSVM